MQEFTVLLENHGAPKMIAADKVVWDTTFLTFYQGETIVSRFDGSRVLGYQRIVPKED